MKAVQLHAHAEAVIQTRVDRTQTGLLLGQSWDAQRVCVLAAVPTPALPKGESSNGGGGWNRTEWFLEHARQVRRMLVGGVELIGLYVHDGNADRLRAFEADGLLRDMAFGLPLSPCAVDRIVLRGGGKQLAGEVYTGTKKDALKPKPISSIKVAPIAQALLTLETTLHLDVSIPVQPAANGTPLKLQLRKGLEPFQASVLAAAATIDGRAVDPALVLEKALEGEAGGSSAASKSKGKGSRGGKSKKGASSSSSASAADGDAGEEPTHQVEFFLRPSLLPPPPPSATGVVRLQGACHCRVYAHGKSSVGQALLSLRHDVLSSLQSRLQLLAEDSEDALGAFDLPAPEGGTGLPFFAWNLPRRLFQPILPPSPAAPAVCDYLLAHESVADGVRRIEELMGAQALAEVKQQQQSSAASEPFCRETCEDTEQGDRQPERTWNAPPFGSGKDAQKTIAEASAASPAAAVTTETKGSSGSSLLLPIAFGVVAVAVSVAFFTQMM